jgi:hypothetical protein
MGLSSQERGRIFGEDAAGSRIADGWGADACLIGRCGTPATRVGWDGVGWVGTQVEAAARIANAHDFIKALPEG